MTFRIVTEPGARVAGLQTGRAAGRAKTSRRNPWPMLKNDKNITLLPLKNWWIQIADAEHLAAADRQPDVPQGGPGGAGHGRDHGCGIGRQLPA